MSNPIIRNELNTLLKSPKTLGVQVAFAIAISILVILRWPTSSKVGLSGDQSISVFRIFGYGMLGMTILLIPAFPATSIVKEKIKGTLALLLNSPLSATSIYLGKLSGLLLFVAILLTLSLPAAAACYAMDGIRAFGNTAFFESFSILPLYLVLMIAALQYLVVGLFISLQSQSTDGALRNTYLVVFAMSVATLIPWFFLQGQASMYADIANQLRYISPVTAVAQMMGHGDVGAQGLSNADVGAMRFVIFAAISIAVISGLTIYKLSQRIFDRSRDQGMITDDQSLKVRAARRVFFLIDPNRRKTGIPFYMNPVFVKEFRTRRFGRLHWLLRLVAICAIASIALCYFSTTNTENWGVETIGGIMVLLQVALIVLVIPSLASSMISGEVESGGWNLLRMTPLSTFRIVFGKLMSVVWTAALMLVGTLPGYLVLVWIKPELRPQVTVVVITLILASIVTLSISAAISSLFKKAAVSTSVSYAVIVSLFAGTFLVWLGKDAPFGYDVVRAALLLNPVSPALEAMKTGGFTGYRLYPIGWGISETIALICLGIFFYRTWAISKPS